MLKINTIIKSIKPLELMSFFMLCKIVDFTVYIQYMKGIQSSLDKDIFCFCCKEKAINFINSKRNFYQILKNNLNFDSVNFNLIIADKKKGPTENRTRIIGFKVQCANHYTIGPIENYIHNFYQEPFLDTLDTETFMS